MNKKNQNVINIDKDYAMWDLNAKLQELDTREVNWRWRGNRISEADLRGGIRLTLDFPDETGLLESAVSDLKRFCKQGNVKVLKRGGYPLVCRFAALAASSPEAYRIAVEKSGCLLEAAGIEGIRRGLYYLMNEMRLSEGPFLKLGEVERYPIFRSRFAHALPVDAAAAELGNDAEPLTEGYLSLLAQDGINAVLLPLDLKKLDGKFKNRCEILLAKVNACRRYGIKAYVFGTEPISFAAGSPIFEAFPELADNAGYDRPEIRERLASLLERLFNKVPGLGGIVFRSLKDGYKAAGCAKDGSDSWETASATLKTVEQAITRANPDAEVVFYPYDEVFWRGLDNQLKGASQLPRGITQMRNFESFAAKQQMGQKRVIADNWLSLIGPSVYFKNSAKRSQKGGSPVFAMLPVGCSMEIPTVRSIPVPSNYYRKFRALRSLGIDGIAQGWEMALPPSEMTHAAGLLAFEPFPATEDIFLNKLARMHWNEQFAPQIVTAWKHFAQAFNHFPLCHEFRENGPLQDSVAWHLNLLPAEDDFAARIEDCLAACEFDLDDIIRLTTKLARRWAIGVRIMQQLTRHFRKSPEKMREIALMEAIGILLDAGNGLFKYYELRKQVLEEEGPERLLKLKTLRKMVRRQIELSRRMIMMIEKDPTIGFHFGEGEYRFDIAALNERIAALRLMLQKEFPVVEKRLKAGLPALGED